MSEIKSAQVSIDCDPYQQRPNVYFESLWKEVLKREEPVPEDNSSRRFFGAWFWENVKMTCDEYNAVLDYCRELYNQGDIRGAQLIPSYEES